MSQMSGGDTFTGSTFKIIPDKPNSGSTIRVSWRSILAFITSI